ncbi:MAG: glycosyl hydrolase family 28 protein [Phycisphaeraceae bacterium]
MSVPFSALSTGSDGMVVDLSGATPQQRTAQLQQAMDACAAAGGGTVVVPPGRHEVGTIRLRSHVHLHLQAGATLLASDEPAIFPVLEMMTEGNGELTALVLADDVVNVTITGPGAIAGRGVGAMSWHDAKKLPLRPTMMLLRNCRDVHLAGFAIRDAMFWTLHLLRCKRVRISDVHIDNHWPNSDGIDPDGCEDVIITGCDITAGDDCICLKSTRGDTCQNILVSNCLLSTSCAALKLGTESEGLIRQVCMSRCIVRRAAVAVAIYLKDRGSYEDVFIGDTMIASDGDFPIIVDVTPRDYTDPQVGSIRRITLTNLHVVGSGRLHLEGLEDQPIEGLTLRNIDWHVTESRDFTSVTKPVGGARGRRDANRASLANEPYHLIASCINNLRVENLVIQRPTDSRVGRDRGLARLHQTQCRFVNCQWHGTAANSDALIRATQSSISGQNEIVCT